MTAVTISRKYKKSHGFTLLREYFPFFILITPGILLAFVFIFVPVFYALALSFFKLDTITTPMKFVGLQNYIKILSQEIFWNDFLNGLLYAGLSVFFQVVIGVLIALVLDRRFKFRSLFRAASIVPYVIPTVVAAFTWRWMLDEHIGIVNEIFKILGWTPITWFETRFSSMFSSVLVSVWIWTPFVTLSFLAGLQNMPNELHEAARVDGANALQRFFLITLPFLKPILIIIILLRSIWMFNKFDIIWVLTQGGPLYGTEHLPILSYKKAFIMFEVGEGAAISAINFFVLMIIMYFYLKRFKIDE